MVMALCTYELPSSEVIFFRNRHYALSLCWPVSFMQAFLISLSALVELTHKTA
jgi:hypothetical protein